MQSVLSQTSQQGFVCSACRASNLSCTHTQSDSVSLWLLCLINATCRLYDILMYLLFLEETLSRSRLELLQEPERGLMTIAERATSVTLPENRSGIIPPSFRPLTHCGTISGSPAPRHLSRSVPRPALGPGSSVRLLLLPGSQGAFLATDLHHSNTLPLIVFQRS